jgi:solute carrier family 8 (sodium/calcium exchanger)
VPFKVIYSIVPPTVYAGGWACFFGALILVGGTTIVIGDIATLFGCVWGLDKATTAITFVALGTSLPDTFASMAAAKGDDTADNAIGNVTGSNAVNVFLGLGLPWMLAAMKWANGNPNEQWYAFYGTPVGLLDGVPTIPYTPAEFDAIGKENIAWTPGTMETCPGCAEKVANDYGGGTARFVAPGGALGFSVIVFCSCALATFSILMYRRGAVGAELGGDPAKAKVHAAMCICLWFVYVAMSILKNSGAI